MKTFMCSVYDRKEPVEAVLLSDVAAVQEELTQLRAWKESAMQVESEWDSQAVGKLLGIPLGASIRKNIAPKIKAMQEEHRRDVQQMIDDYQMVIDRRDKEIATLQTRWEIEHGYWQEQSKQIATLTKRCEELEKEKDKQFAIAAHERAEVALLRTRLQACEDALRSVMQRLNERGTGEMGLIDTIHAAHKLAQAALNRQEVEHE